MQLKPVWSLFLRVLMHWGWTGNTQKHTHTNITHTTRTHSPRCTTHLDLPVNEPSLSHSFPSVYMFLSRCLVLPGWIQTAAVCLCSGQAQTHLPSPACSPQCVSKTCHPTRPLCWMPRWRAHTNDIYKTSMRTCCKHLNTPLWDFSTYVCTHLNAFILWFYLSGVSAEKIQYVWYFSITGINISLHVCV